MAEIIPFPFYAGERLKLEGQASTQALLHVQLLTERTKLLNLLMQARQLEDSPELKVMQREHRRKLVRDTANLSKLSRLYEQAEVAANDMLEQLPDGSRATILVRDHDTGDQLVIGCRVSAPIVRATSMNWVAIVNN